MKEIEVRRAIERGLSTAGEKAIEPAAFDLQVFLLESGDVPDALFTFLQNTFRSTGFLDKTGSWAVLRTVQNNWDLLTEQQRTALMQTIESIYDLPRD